MKLAGSVLVLGLALVAGAQQEELKKIAPDVEAVKKSARKITKEAREKIEAAIERKLDEKEMAVQIWEARASVPEANPTDKVRILYAVVPAKGPKGDFKIGVAIAPDERVIAGVRMIENRDDPAIGSEEWLAQFEMFVYTSNVSNPASALDQARAASAARKDEKGKQLDGIFKLHAIMHPVETAWANLQDHLEEESKDAAADADRLGQLFTDTEKVLGDLTFLKQSQVDSFRRRLRDSVKNLNTLVGQVRAGKMVEARATSSDVYKSSCSQCHAGTQRIFREKRLELGVGNGYFSVGHDVKAPDASRDSYQAAAKAIRLGVLILSEAK